MSDWKKHHAEEAEKALGHELVQHAMEEFAHNMGFKLEGLPAYGLSKIAGYAAQIARAQALGFDPDLLRMSNEEASAAMLRLAQAAAESGKPVWLIDARADEGEGE